MACNCRKAPTTPERIAAQKAAEARRAVLKAKLEARRQELKRR